MATHAPTIAALDFYRAATNYQSAIGPRLMVTTDEDVDLCEAAIAPAFDTLMTAPAPSIEAVAVKTAAIISEFGEGDVPVEHVLRLYRDMTKLLAS